MFLSAASPQQSVNVSHLSDVLCHLKVLSCIICIVFTVDLLYHQIFSLYLYLSLLHVCWEGGAGKEEAQRDCKITHALSSCYRTD